MISDKVEKNSHGHKKLLYDDKKQIYEKKIEFYINQRGGLLSQFGKDKEEILKKIQNFEKSIIVDSGNKMVLDYELYINIIREFETKIFKGNVYRTGGTIDTNWQIIESGIFRYNIQTREIELKVVKILNGKASQKIVSLKNLLSWQNYDNQEEIIDMIYNFYSRIHDSIDWNETCHYFFTEEDTLDYVMNNTGNNKLEINRRLKRHGINGNIFETQEEMNEFIKRFGMFFRTNPKNTIENKEDLKRKWIEFTKQDNKTADIQENIIDMIYNFYLHLYNLNTSEWEETYNYLFVDDDTMDNVKNKNGDLGLELRKRLIRNGIKGNNFNSQAELDNFIKRLGNFFKNNYMETIKNKDILKQKWMNYQKIEQERDIEEAWIFYENVTDFDNIWDITYEYFFTDPDTILFVQNKKNDRIRIRRRIAGKGINIDVFESQEDLDNFIKKLGNFVKNNPKNTIINKEDLSMKWSKYSN